jgi:hypothetical protein
MAQNDGFYGRNKDELIALSTIPPSCPEPPTNPIILFIDKPKDKWQRLNHISCV